ncbi:MAG: hypothetical protein WCO92_00020 [Verrucomicrobiota bacterium]
MLSCATSSNHLPPATLPNSTAVENKDAAPTQKSVGSLIRFFNLSLSGDHATLLAAAEKAKNHFQSLPATEQKSLVTEKIIQSEKGIAQVAATSASRAKGESIPVIKTLRRQCSDEDLLSMVTTLESRLQHASEQATQNATHATSATEKQIVQVDAKSALLHAAVARLTLAQLHQLEPQRSTKNSKQGEDNLKTAETDYQKASHELALLFKTTSLSFEVVTGVSRSDLDSKDEIGITDDEASGSDEVTGVSGSDLDSNDEIGITDDEASGSDEENKGSELKSALTEVGPPLIDGPEEATQDATDAFSATHEEMVQVDAKSAVLHAADTRLPLASNEGKEAAHGEVDRNSFEDSSSISSDDTSSLIENDNESLDDGGDTWRDVSDEEAIRSVEVDRMSNEDSRVE